jgi:hypothetical protein
MDLMGGSVALAMSIRQEWNDTRLVWNPSSYSNVDTVWTRSDEGSNAPSGYTPDTLIVENAGATKLSNTLPTEVEIHSNGTVIWDTNGEVEVNFTPDITYYPYDT